MKILVTGGAGFIGSNFIRLALSLGHGLQVVNFDKLTYAGNLANLQDLSSDSNYSFIKGDICDGVAVARAMAGCDAVVHFAAESHVDRSIYEPAQAIETNITGTFILLQVARELKIRKFVHISTDEVYGDLAQGVASDETFPCAPAVPIPPRKRARTCWSAPLCARSTFPGVITRASNNYGPYQFPEKFVPLMIMNALDDKPLPVYGDGLQQRDWLHVEDHCRGILAVLEKGRVGEVYNIGGTDIVDNLTMVRRILKLLGKPESLIQYVADRPGHDRRYALDSSKLEKELGWKPQHALEAGLRETIDWYRANTQWIAGVRDGAYRQYYKKYYENRTSTLQELASTRETFSGLAK